MMQISYSFKGYIDIPLKKTRPMKDRIAVLKDEITRLPQYQPLTEHYFHGGMYCRKVYRDAGVCVIGKVHRKEHFYVITSGTVSITDGNGETQEITGPHVIKSMPGTQRAVTSITPVTCMTFHMTDSKTIEDVEKELVEDDQGSMYLPGNVSKQEVLS